ncbi:MAG: diadenylate cyclase CdaA [Leptospira sp.]|nr:diadenylate cyclase CdaA [Leptospira sp.]
MQLFKTIPDFQFNSNSAYVFLDILIVSFIIYKFYMLLRRTRGIQLLLGVAFIWALGSIADYFELELLDWLITNIRPALVFAIIVLLQPELRRITGELAKIRILKLFILKPGYDLDEIVEAVRIMSANKTGSIIVLVKEIGLKDIIERSVPLDAIVTSSLLLTIFKKNSALHDGAVIIEQNRIVSASSYLPMSSNLGNSTLGARHRSALGLAEESDAVIIVTSEENGNISICYDGELYSPIKSSELKNQLTNFLEENDKFRERKALKNGEEAKH